MRLLPIVKLNRHDCHSFVRSITYLVHDYKSNLLSKIFGNPPEEFKANNEDLSVHLSGRRIHRLQTREGIRVSFLNDHPLGLTRLANPLVCVFLWNEVK